MTVTLDDLARDQNRWSLLEDLLRSGQVPEARIAELEDDHPQFAVWRLSLRRRSQNDVNVNVAARGTGP